MCVCLLPVSTGTNLFHKIILPNAEVRFLKSRVKFLEFGIKEQKTGTRDSMVVIFGGKK